MSMTSLAAGVVFGAEEQVELLEVSLAAAGLFILTDEAHVLYSPRCASTFIRFWVFFLSSTSPRNRPPTSAQDQYLPLPSANIASDQSSW